MEGYSATFEYSLQMAPDSHSALSTDLRPPTVILTKARSPPRGVVRRSVAIWLEPEREDSGSFEELMKRWSAFPYWLN